MNQSSILTRARALEIASLERSAGRRKFGQFRVEGWRAVESALMADAPLLEIIARSDLIDDPKLGQLLRRNPKRRVGSSESPGEGGCVLYSLPTRAVAKLASVVHDQGILAVCRIPPSNPRALDVAHRVVVLDGVQDPGNVGTVVRCAAWFGFDAVVAGPETAGYYNPKVVRSMAGAVWDVSLVETDNLPATLSRLGKAGFEIAAADMGGVSLAEWIPAEKSVLVLGSEGLGLTGAVRETVDKSGTLIRIEGAVHARPHPGTDDETLGRVARVSGVESLNVAVAAGIIMHKMRT